jgi:hypothetical protein
VTGGTDGRPTSIQSGSTSELWRIMPGVGLCRIAAAKLSTTRGTLDTIIDSLQVGSLEQPEVRKKAFFWLA